MRIANNVEMIEINGMGSVIYPVLIWDDDNLVLIDAGFPGQKDTIVQAITDAGFIAERLSHTYDMDLALRSAEKVKGFPFRAVVAYHGGFLK